MEKQSGVTAGCGKSRGRPRKQVNLESCSSNTLSKEMKNKSTGSTRKKRKQKETDDIAEMGSPKRKRIRKQVPSISREAGSSWNSPRIPRAVATGEMYQDFVAWNLLEKKQLLEAVKKYSPEDINHIVKMIPSRTRKEVEQMLAKVKMRASDLRPCDTGLKAPIESWLDLARELVYYEETDLSQLIARLMSIVSNYEEFPAGTSPHQPKYKKIYQYLAAVLKDVDLPELSPLDNAVILDLMHGLADTLHSVDLCPHRRVMKWKYEMLNAKVDINNQKESARQTKKALTNDFPASLWVKSSKAKNASGRSQVSSSKGSFSQAGTSQQNDNSHSGETTHLGAKSSDQRGERGGSDAEPVAQEKRKPETVEEPLEKPKLYTLNPFCIPVELLRLHSNTEINA